MHAVTVAHVRMQAQNANMDGGMLDLYPSPADLRKQQVADIQAKRQEKVLSSLPLPCLPCSQPLISSIMQHCKDCAECLLQT